MNVVGKRIISCLLVISFVGAGCKIGCELAGEFGKDRRVTIDEELR